MRIFLTGASGFVGSAVVDELLSRGHEINALVHSRPLTKADPRVRSIPGSLTDPGSIESAMEGCDAVIHLVGIIREDPKKGITFEKIHFEGARNVIAAAARLKIRRFIHMSALGTRPDAISTYHRTKFAAEEHLRASPLDWTILQPSMIHGPGGEFMQMESAWARKKAPPFLFMPYFGAGFLGTRGAGKLQPIHVNDVARAFVDAIDNPKTIHQTYGLGGPDVLTWQQLHHTVSQILLGKTRWTLAIPAWKAMFLTRLVPARFLPFNRDQVIMSQEDNTCDLEKFQADFGWSPRSFESTLRSYAAEL